MREHLPRQHALRQRLLDEVHARTFSAFQGAGRFIRFVYLTNRGDDVAIIDHVNTYLAAHDHAKMPDSSKYMERDFGRFSLRVERHTEFVSISIIEDGLSAKTGLAKHAFEAAQLPHLPFQFIAEMPVECYHAIWLEIGGKTPKTLTQKAAQDEAEAMLASRAAPSNMIDGDAAQLLVSFDADDAGFSRAVIFNHKMPPLRMGRMVQRVVEMETYRFLAMLGFAKAQEASGKLSSIATRLTTLTRGLSKTIRMSASQHNNEDEDQKGLQDLVKTLSTLSAQIEELYADTLYRMSATKAYREVFEARMSALRLSYFPNFQGVEGFINRRMTPAMETCEAFSRRLDRVAQRIERAGQLLQTQTEMKIQEQNRDLLQSMDRRAKAQLRMQQTVEGLSIAALTYYGVGLVGFMAKGLPLAAWGADLDLIKAVAVPLVGGTAFTIIRRTSRKISQDVDRT